MFYEDGVMAKTLEMEDLEGLNIDHWPSISENDIKDKSKGDSFSKGFVVLQTTWFVTQCIARGVAGLMITELELATFAFAVLNGILYFLWWNKPLDVFCHVPVHLCHPTSYRNITFAPPDDEQLNYTDNSLSPNLNMESPLERHSSTSFQHSLAYTFKRFRVYFGQELKDKGLFIALVHIFIRRPFQIIWSPALFMLYDSYLDTHLRGQASYLSVPTFYAPSTFGDNRARLMGVCIGVLFGGIHCIAWSFEFQSVAEQYLWRISAVNVTVLPVIIAASVIAVTYMKYLGIIRYTLFPCTVLYWLSRVVLLILPLIALRSLPSASLVDFKWSAFIPHI